MSKHRNRRVPRTLLTADGAYEAAAADVTSDGTKDLLVASSSDDAVDVFTGSCE
jgi:hypothetical protein